MGQSRYFPLIRAGLVAFALALIVLIALHFLGFAGVSSSEEEVLPAPVRTKLVNGETHVVLTTKDLAAGSIIVTTLHGSSYQDSISAFGSIVSPQTLAEARKAYGAAAFDAARAALALNAARLEVSRMRPLHGDNRIISDKTLEAAQVTLAEQEAASRAAQDQLRLQQATIREQWGPSLAGWFAGKDAGFDRLLSGEDKLVQIALPAGAPISSAQTASIELSSGDHLTARIVASVAEVDAKFQGQVLYGILHDDPRLLSGMNLPVMVPAGRAASGVLVPDSALIHADGKLWVFVVVGKDEFVRRAVNNVVATPQGWLVRTGLSAGEVIVTQGSQLLLSEELKAQNTSRSPE